MPEYSVKLRENQTNRVIHKRVFEASYSEAEKEARFLEKTHDAKIISVDNNQFPLGEYKPVS